MVINSILFKYSKLIIIFSFFVILFTHFGSVKFYNICKNLISLFMNKQKDKVCICVIGKEENRYIKEYVEHYKKLGVDKIFLYDNNEKNGERFESVLSQYINEGFVSIINYRGKFATQLIMYEKCYNSNKYIYDWFIFFDIDEFINLNNYTNIKDFLNENKFNKCNLIYFNCLRHTDNDLLYYDNRTLKEKFPIIKWDNQLYTVKSMMRGNNPMYVTFSTTHWLDRELKNGCDVFGNYVEPTVELKIGKNIKKSDVYIDHYCFKSTEEYINKINKGDARFGFNKGIQMHKIYLYFTYNKITLEKIKFIENKTRLNLTRYKLMLNKKDI